MICLKIERRTRPYCVHSGGWGPFYDFLLFSGWNGFMMRPGLILPALHPLRYTATYLDVRNKD